MFSPGVWSQGLADGDYYRPQDQRHKEGMYSVKDSTPRHWEFDSIYSSSLVLRDVPTLMTYYYGLFVRGRRRSIEDCCTTAEGTLPHHGGSGLAIG